MAKGGEHVNPEFEKPSFEVGPPLQKNLVPIKKTRVRGARTLAPASGLGVGWCPLLSRPPQHVLMYHLPLPVKEPFKRPQPLQERYLPLRRAHNKNFRNLPVPQWHLKTECYLGPVIPEDAVMPTPPSTHAQPLSTPARPLCVIRMLQRNPPFLDLNVPVIRMDNSGPVHRPRRQKRQLYDVRKPASTLPVQANAARLQQQPKNPVSDSANEGSRAISSLIAAAQLITDSDIGDEDERTRDDIKKKRKVDSIDWRAREASFEEFAERADGVMGRFFAWAKEPEPELKHLPKPSQRPSAPLSGVSIYAKKLFMLAHSASFSSCCT